MARYVICPECGSEIRRNDMFEIDGRPMCVHCLEKHLNSMNKPTEEELLADSEYRAEIDSIFNKKVSEKSSDEVSAEKQMSETERKINELRYAGYNGYYEYKSLTFNSDKSGEFNADKIVEQINLYALDGWRVCDSLNNMMREIYPFADADSNCDKVYVSKAVVILERFKRI